MTAFGEYVLETLGIFKRLGTLSLCNGFIQWFVRKVIGFLGVWSCLDCGGYETCLNIAFTIEPWGLVV